MLINSFNSGSVKSLLFVDYYLLSFFLMLHYLCLKEAVGRLLIPVTRVDRQRKRQTDG